MFDARLIITITFLLFIVQFQAKAQNSTKKEEPGYLVETLRNSHLKVSILLPDKKHGYYRSTRFDWSGIIAQVEYGKHTYFQNWENNNATITGGQHDPLDTRTATGTAEEFRDPLGYNDAKAGEPFLKIGVGILQRADEKPYHWAFPYKVIEFGDWTVIKQKHTLIFRQAINTDFGYGYEYEKKIILSNNSSEVKITHFLKNTGKKEINTNPYCHNFFRFDNEHIGENYKLSFTNPIKFIDNFETKATINSNCLSVNYDFSDDTRSYGFIDPNKSNTFTLSNSKTNTSVKVISDIEPGPFYLFFWKLAFCPEPMVNINIKPCKSVSWQRIYTFSK